MSSQGSRPGYGSDASLHGVEKRPLTSVKNRQRHIAHIARKYTDSPLTTLSYHMDMLWMREAFSRLNKDSEPGTDKVTVEEYAKNLESNLAELLERAKSGSYRPPPVKRVHIRKNGKETRPIGVPATESKVLERAVTMLLEPLYEQEFLDCSYGFRPGRSTHQGLEQLRQTLKGMNGGWVLDVDVRKYFDSIPHDQLMSILRLRVKDSVILRLIVKWLKAGVWENGEITPSESGTPQGGVISPLLSNIYLHVVLDVWFEQVVKLHVKGPARMIRFADDFVIVFKRREDALKVLRVLPKRFGRYGLEIHPEKTQLVDFRHPWESRRKPQTFTFLGFTHYWGKTRRGGYAVKKKTSAKKMRQSLKRMHQWCKKNCHQPLGWQHEKLCQKLAGHYAAYSVAGNYAAVAAYRYHVLHTWRYWLNRRSRKKDGMGWSRFAALLQGKYRVPYPRIIHKAAREQQVCLSF